MRPLARGLTGRQNTSAGRCRLLGHRLGVLVR